MKKICNILILAGVMAAPNLFATMSVTLYDSSSYSDSVGGGEFRAVGNAALDSKVDWNAYNTSTAHNTADANHTYFQTFCTELNESFSPGSSYTVTSIGNYTDGTVIPITLSVAYLYSQFAAGSLAGYNWSYGSSRAASALNLQLAIWALLGESNSGIHPSVTGVAYADLLAVTGNGSDDIFKQKSDWYSVAANGAYGVQDMFLGNHQDQLIITIPSVPKGQPTPVPEPTTIFAGLLLLIPFGVSMARILRKLKLSSH